MSSGRKDKPSKDVIMMTPGLRAQIPASPSLSLASASSRRALNYTNAGYENADSICSGHDYEDLGQYQSVTMPRKQTNAIYESTPSPLANAVPMGSYRHRQITECSDDSTSTGSFEQYHHTVTTKTPRSRNNRDYLLACIAFFSLVSLVLVSLMAAGVRFVDPKEERVVTRHSMAKISLNQPLSRNGEDFMEGIRVWQQNISSLITDLQKQVETLRKRIDEESHTDQFKNISNEVRTLRTKQDIVDNNIADLQSNDQSKSTKIQEIERKIQVVGIKVQFLALNDSLIKSEISGLLQSDSKIKDDIAKLKNKDAALESSLESLRARDATFNASVDGLRNADAEMKMALGVMNRTVATKINNITKMVNELQSAGGKQGPPGPVGPIGPQGLQGPAGPQGKAANFAGCTHGYDEKSATAIGTSSTAVARYILQATDKVVLGATCSTKGFDETNLEVVKNSKGNTVYVCNCLGESSYSGTRTDTNCRLDYWLCPKS